MGMLPQEFKAQMGRLLNVFSTRKNISAMMPEYERAFLSMDHAEFTRAVTNVIDQNQFFPSIAELRRAVPQTREVKSQDPTAEGCQYCMDGLVETEVWKEGMTYTHVCACVCPRGHQRMRVKYGKHSMRSIADVDPQWQANVRAGVKEELATTTRQLHELGEEEEGVPF